MLGRNTGLRRRSRLLAHTRRLRKQRQHGQTTRAGSVTAVGRGGGSFIVLGVTAAAVCSFAVAARGDSATDVGKTASIAAGTTLDPSVVDSNFNPPTLFPSDSAQRPLTVPGALAASAPPPSRAVTRRAPVAPRNLLAYYAEDLVVGFYSLKHFPADPTARSAIVADPSFVASLRNKVARYWVFDQVDRQTQTLTAELRLMAHDPSLESLSQTTLDIISVDEQAVQGNTATVAFTATLTETPAGGSVRTSEPYQFQVSLMTGRGLWRLTSLNAVPTGGQG
jgi:hypothetical protein